MQKNYIKFCQTQYKHNNTIHSLIKSSKSIHHGYQKLEMGQNISIYNNMKLISLQKNIIIIQERRDAHLHSWKQNSREGSYCPFRKQIDVVYFQSLKYKFRTHKSYEIIQSDYFHYTEGTHIPFIILQCIGRSSITITFLDDCNWNPSLHYWTVL